MNNEEIKQIIVNNINTAICIDDEYVEPYNNTPTGTDTPKKLYTSFRNEGNCLLDVYQFETYEKYESKKDYILNHRDLIILDWELDKEGEKYQNTLRILGDCFTSPEANVVCIYTSESNLGRILFTIIAEFGIITKEKERFKHLCSLIDEVLTEEGASIDIDTLKSRTENLVKNFSLDKENRNKGEYDIKKNLRDNLGNDCFIKICRIIRKFKTDYYIKNNTELLHWLCYLYNTEPYNGLPISEKKGDYQNNIISSNSLIINNTIIFLFSKEKTGGVSPDKLFNKLVSEISEYPNYKTYLFKSIIREPIHRSLTVFGKGLNNIDENVLIYHAKKYRIDEDLNEYIAKLLGIQITDIFKKSISIDKIRDLFKPEEVKGEPENSDLAKLDSLLTFNPKSKRKQTRKIHTGDVFKLSQKIYFCDNIEGEYLICITQSCDCAIPQKIGYNFAFALGKEETSLETAVKNAEKEYYTFCLDNRVIKWTKNFFTINLKLQYEFNEEDPIKIMLNDLKKFEMTYLGNMKDYYAQRIVNYVFNNALRIGIDLPNISS